MGCVSKIPAIHVVAIPYPGQGHINPMMQLCKKLASRPEIIVTFILTHSWRNIINQAYLKEGCDAFVHAHNLGLHIRVAEIPDCVPGEFDRWANFCEFVHSLADMEHHVEQLIHKLNQDDDQPPVTCIVADTFLTWSVPLANKLGVSSVCFWTQAMAVFNFFYSSSQLVEPVQNISIKDYATQQASTPMEELDRISTMPDITYRAFQNVRNADWVVANSFHELEIETMDTLWVETPVYCVGPLLPSAFLEGLDNRDTAVGTSSRAELNCSEFLDNKPPHSVIYVSFGSLVHLSRDQVEEIAMGLLESKHFFLWVLRPDETSGWNMSDMLPGGFLDHMENQGLVVPWSAQIQVLSHPSVGGFLSHCGWNSVIESVSSGIPMLGFPQFSDQLTNCKLLVDEWKIGLRLRKSGGDEHHEEESVVERGEIARGVRGLMECHETRERAEKLRDVAKKAVTKGGRGLALMPLLLINPSPELAWTIFTAGILSCGAAPHAMAWHADPPWPRRVVSAIPPDLQRKVPLPSPPMLLRAIADAVVGHQTSTLHLQGLERVPLPTLNHPLTFNAHAEHIRAGSAENNRAVAERVENRVWLHPK
eukprot:Gb_14888 [translate_table: standard]